MGNTLSTNNEVENYRLARAYLDQLSLPSIMENKDNIIVRKQIIEELKKIHCWMKDDNISKIKRMDELSNSLALEEHETRTVNAQLNAQRDLDSALKMALLEANKQGHEELKAHQELKVEFSQKTDEWSQKELNLEAKISSIIEENSTLKRAILEVERQGREELKAHQELKVEFSQKTDEWSQKELNFEAKISSINQYTKTIIEENSTLKRTILEVEQQGREELKAHQELNVELCQKTAECSQKVLNLETKIYSINQYSRTIIEENSTLKRAILEAERQITQERAHWLTERSRLNSEVEEHLSINEQLSEKLKKQQLSVSRNVLEEDTSCRRPTTDINEDSPPSIRSRESDPLFKGLEDGLHKRDLAKTPCSLNSNIVIEDSRPSRRSHGGTSSLLSSENASLKVGASRCDHNANLTIYDSSR